VGGGRIKGEILDARAIEVPSDASTTETRQAPDGASILLAMSA